MSQTEYILHLIGSILIVLLCYIVISFITTDVIHIILVMQSEKENTVQSDHIVSLKDHSVDKKPILKPIAGFSLKRSTSQPNLSDDISSTNKQTLRNDVTPSTHSSKQLDPMALNREFKPRYVMVLI